METKQMNQVVFVKHIENEISDLEQKLITESFLFNELIQQNEKSTFLSTLEETKLTLTAEIEKVADSFNDITVKTRNESEIACKIINILRKHILNEKKKLKHLKTHEAVQLSDLAEIQRGVSEIRSTYENKYVPFQERGWIDWVCKSTPRSEIEKRRLLGIFRYEELLYEKENQTTISKDENCVLKRKVEQLKNKIDKEQKIAEERANKLKAEKTDLKKRIQEQEKEITRMEKDNFELKKRENILTTKMNEERRMAKKTSNSLTAEIFFLKRRLENVQEDMEKLSNRYSHLEKENLGLKAKFADVKIYHQTYCNKMEKTLSCDKTPGELEKEYETLKIEMRQKEKENEIMAQELTMALAKLKLSKGQSKRYEQNVDKMEKNEKVQKESLKTSLESRYEQNVDKMEKKEKVQKELLKTSLESRKDSSTYSYIQNENFGGTSTNDSKNIYVDNRITQITAKNVYQIEKSTVTTDSTDSGIELSDASIQLEIENKSHTYEQVLEKEDNLNHL